MGQVQGSKGWPPENTLRSGEAVHQAGQGMGGAQCVRLLGKLGPAK